MIQDKIPFMGQKAPLINGVYRQNFDEERLVDLSIVKKQTGEKKFGLFPIQTPYLEGYIRGIVVDYDDTPVEGIVVRVADKGKDLPGYDPGISDANGIYRIRFSHPLKGDRLELRGTISYNPSWPQQYEMLGRALEPQTKETKFHIVYDRRLGIIGMGEDLPKTIVRAATGPPKDKKDKFEKKKIQTPPPPPPTSSNKQGEDLFSGFGDFKP